MVTNDEPSTSPTEVWLTIKDLMGIPGAIKCPISLSRETFDKWTTTYDPFILKQLMKFYITIDSTTKRVDARWLRRFPTS